MKQLSAYFSSLGLLTAITNVHATSFDATSPSNSSTSATVSYEAGSIAFETLTAAESTPQLSQVDVLKVLVFASNFYISKLEKMGFKRNLLDSLDNQIKLIESYIKDCAKQLNLSESDFSFLFSETERLIRQKHFAEKDKETIKRIISICARIPSKKIEERLTNAGIDPEIQKTLFSLVAQVAIQVADRVFSDSCCGGRKKNLIDILQMSTEPQ